MTDTHPHTLTRAELAQITATISRWVRADMKQARAEHIRTRAERGVAA